MSSEVSTGSDRRPTKEELESAHLKEMQALQDLQASSLEDQVGFYRRLDAATSRLTPDGLPCKGALDETLWRGACGPSRRATRPRTRRP